MLIILPVSASDAHLIVPLVEVMTKFSGLEQHRALVVTAESTRDEGESYTALIRSLFAEVNLFVLPKPAPPGWPQGCNAYFAMTADHLEISGNTEPWYWLEADCTPLTEGWIASLVAEYELAKMPFMGAKEQTTARRPDGSVIADGYHMVGTGIYPPNLSKFTTLHRYADNIPWDTFWRWEIINHIHPTKLIQHNWGTGNYRRTGKGGHKISCESVKSGANRDMATDVRPDAVVLHGCRDNSLRHLVLKLA